MLLLALLSSSMVNAAGFALGNEFQTTELYGQMQLVCVNGVQETRTFVQCRGELFSPDVVDYFVADESVDADEVTLSNVYEGKTRTQTKKYDSQKNQSKKYFNLWLASLFQRPLLNYGENNVKYTLTKDGNTVKEGEFKATVTEQGSRECGFRTIYSYNGQYDCNAGASQACREYFRQENHCK